MKKIIATTTINAPTEAIRQYDAMEDWELLVVGDRKTPEYKLERGYYMSWEEQQDRYRPFCDLIGPDSVARGRMIAWVEAYKRGAEILASIDDDVDPYTQHKAYEYPWGEVLVGKEIEAIELIPEHPILCFNPFYECGPPHCPPARGFPIDCEWWHSIKERRKVTIKPLVQVNMCDGQADFDAKDRFNCSDDICFDIVPKPYFMHCFSPINTQNTIIHRDALKDFPANIPFIGRADDIWAGYMFQNVHRRSTIYCGASAYHKQVRMVESLIDDLENEIFMYRNTYAFLKQLVDLDLPNTLPTVLPHKSMETILLYQSYFE